MPVKISSMIKFYIILFLMERPKHGYEIMKGLEEKIGRCVSTSQVYPFLNTLKKSRLVMVKNIGKRDKKIYSLSNVGRVFAEKMVARAGELFYIALKPKISICTHCGCKIIEGGYKEAINGKKMVFCCPHCAHSYKV